MSRYYASMRGSAKTEATRRGSSKSGIVGHVRGYDIGVRVEDDFNPKNDRPDRFSIYATQGSNNPLGRVRIADIYLDKNGEAWVEFNLQGGEVKHEKLF